MLAANGSGIRDVVGALSAVTRAKGSEKRESNRDDGAGLALDGLANECSNIRIAHSLLKGHKVVKRDLVEVRNKRSESTVAVEVLERTKRHGDVLYQDGSLEAEAAAILRPWKLPRANTRRAWLSGTPFTS